MAASSSRSQAVVGHAYGPNTIAGSATVHLGDVHSHHYSTTDAKDAIYRNTLTVVLREILEDVSSYGKPARLPCLPDFAQRRKDSTEAKLQRLELYLTRVQEIEQKEIHDSINQHDRKQVLDSIMAEGKVAQYLWLAKKKQHSLASHVRRRCSNREGLDCLDAICELVQRLSRQIAVRVSLDRAFEQLHLNNTNDLLDVGEMDVLESIDAGSFMGKAQAQPLRDPRSTHALFTWQQEYLYATQDLWRQIVSILDDLLIIRSRYLQTTIYRVCICLVGTFVIDIVLVNVMERLLHDQGITTPTWLFNTLFFSLLLSIFGVLCAVLLFEDRRFIIPYYTQRKNIMVKLHMNSWCRNRAKRSRVEAQSLGQSHRNPQNYTTPDSAYYA